MAKLADAADEILSKRRVAVTGVSRRPENHGANVVYKRLRDRGYEVFPVNPNASEVEDHQAYPDLGSIPGGVEAVVIGTAPGNAPQTIRQCIDLGIQHVWFHRGPGQGSVNPEAAQEGRDNGLTVIEGGCPCMFGPTADLGHRTMRPLLQLGGSVPRRTRTPRMRFAPVAVLALVLLAGGCGDNDEGSPAVARAEAERVDVRHDVEPISSAIGSFGWNLYRELASEESNLVASPHSIGIALTMTRAGAAGDTAAEMDRVLQLDRVTDPHAGANALDRAMTSAAGDRERPDGSTAEIVVDVTNALWAQDGFGFEPPFLSTLAENYGAGVRLVDYIGAHEAARQDINDWVAGQTADRVDELIGPGVLSPDTRAVLTNTVYLNAPWEHPFDDAGTLPGSFTRLDGTEADVELMSTSESFRYARIGDVQAVELPYVGGELSMVVLVPDPGAFEVTAAGIDHERLAATLDGLQPTPVDLRFPRFEFTTTSRLVPALTALGMDSAFDPAMADFSAMTTEASLFVSDVIHEAFISVDEGGTEAAASTAVVMDLTAAPVEGVELVVNRPFLFAIIHRDSSGVLFLGHVVDPLAS